MKDRVLIILLVLVLTNLPMAANAGWSEAQQAADQTLPAPSLVEKMPTPDVNFNTSPVMFIENAGQWDDGARFQVWGGPVGTMWLAEDAIWITLMEPAVESQPIEGASERQPSTTSQSRRGVHIKFSFVGANSSPEIEAASRLDTKVSYFLDQNPEKWRVDVPVWSRVQYTDLYAGIDLVLGSETDGLWHLTADAGAVFDTVRLRVEGAELSVAADGKLRLITDLGEMTIPLPISDFAYIVEGTTAGNQTVQLSVPSSLPNIVQDVHQTQPEPLNNPADLLYGTYLGGYGGYGSYDIGSSIVFDAAGRMYVTGSTESGNFPTTPGSFDTHFDGFRDAFIARLSTTGSALEYCTFLGGSEEDGSNAIVLDGTGRAYVTGYTDSANFPITPGAFDTSYGGSGDAFVSRLSASGSALEYSTFLGGNDSEGGIDVAIDGTGRVYAAGHTRSTNFPTTPGAFDTSYNGGYADAYMVRLTANGSTLEYGTFLGGSALEEVLGIAIDNMGRMYTTGRTESFNFPTTPGAFDTSYNGAYGDAFVSRLSANGSALEYSTFLGGNSGDGGRDVAIDYAGRAYVTGYTTSSGFPTTPGAYDTSFNAGYSEADAFVARLSSNGNILEYGTFLGGISSDYGRAIAVDNTGRIHVTGIARSTNFPTTLNAYNPVINGFDDTFVTRFSVNGSALEYSTFLGGIGGDYSWDMIIDTAGRVLVAGVTDSNDFPTTPGAFDRTYNGGFSDVFVVKLAMGTTPPSTYTISGRVTSTNGAGIAGVTVHDNAGHSAITNANGNYALSGLAPGTYNITPGMNSYAFCPSTRRVIVSANVSEQDFTGFGANVTLGFCPNPQGYQFSNSDNGWGEFPFTAYDYRRSDLVRMFGQDNVCWMTGLICWVKPQANLWHLQANLAMNGGHCDGMASTSLRFFKGNDSPATFKPNASTAHDLGLNDVRRHIAYYFVEQMTDPVSAYKEQVRQNMPSAILSQLRTAMQGGTLDPTTLFIRPVGDHGHVVTPYAIEDKGNGVSWVRVYDNNYPDDLTRYVTIDAINQTWSYDLGSTTWTGDRNTHTLGIVPISKYAEQPICPWCDGSSNMAAPDNPLMQEVWFDGSGHLLITDAQGRRLGYSGTQFVSEIPGAYGGFIDGGLGVELEPIYRLPVSDGYAILLDGQTVTQPGNVAVSQFGPGYAAEVGNIQLRSSDRDSIAIAPDGSQITYQPNGSRRPTLSLALDDVAASFELAVTDAEVAAGQRVTVAAQESTGHLVYSNAQASGGDYGLFVQRVSASGVHLFAHNALTVAGGDTHYAAYRSWDGQGSMTLLIDHASNGTIDETVTLENQIRRTYLPVVVGN